VVVLTSSGISRLRTRMPEDDSGALAGGDGRWAECFPLSVVLSMSPWLAWRRGGSASGSSAPWAQSLSLCGEESRARVLLLEPRSPPPGSSFAIRLVVRLETEFFQQPVGGGN
jgi:hypothetical protein